MRAGGTWGALSMAWRGLAGPWEVLDGHPSIGPSPRMCCHSHSSARSLSREATNLWSFMNPGRRT